MRAEAVCPDSIRFMERVWNFAFETALGEYNVKNPTERNEFLPLFAVLLDRNCSDAEAGQASFELSEGVQLAFPASFKGVCRLSSLSSPNAMLEFVNFVKHETCECEKKMGDWSILSKSKSKKLEIQPPRPEPKKKCCS